MCIRDSAKRAEQGDDDDPDRSREESQADAAREIGRQIAAEDQRGEGNGQGHFQRPIQHAADQGRNQPPRLQLRPESLTRTARSRTIHLCRRHTARSGPAPVFCRVSDYGGKLARGNY